ncbi:MAG TPA: helix-turn-helix domain-containing GNAT family N-acetyltransferase [Solirubrobacteraceae bacterium]|nr:helix-turn-helix domain-containing GNAT family N-acetyltransferase [Solirubrobacteraceae bacterium]
MLREQDIALARSFNRLVTRHVGALNDRHLDRRPLAELRVLFEIGTEDVTPRDIRVRLGLDSGYVSRMIGALKRDGLITAELDSADRRTSRLRLSAAGLAEVRELDRLTDEHVAATFAALTDEQQSRLLRAQAEVRRLLAIAMVTIAPEDHSSADARWCLEHYFGELAERFEKGFDPQQTLPVGRLDVFLVARLSGQPAGCGGLKTLAPGVGELVRMWIDRPHRGLGIGARLLAALEEEAAARGHETLRLYTNRALSEAQAMYTRHGYVEIDRYNDDPVATNFFEKRLA